MVEYLHDKEETGVRFPCCPRRSTIAFLGSDCLIPPVAQGGSPGRHRVRLPVKPHAERGRRRVQLPRRPPGHGCAAAGPREWSLILSAMTVPAPIAQRTNASGYEPEEWGFDSLWVHVKWNEIEPEDAVDIDCSARPDLDPPLNENGDVCPWPWEPQQLKAAPLGQYHCGYCGAMCMAGLPHPDYRDDGYEDKQG